MTPEQIYNQLAFNHQLTDDDRQELAIQLWTKREQYVASAGTLSAWVNAAANNYLVSKSRSKKERENNLTNPLSNYEREEEGHTTNYISDFLASDELSPLEWMVDIQEKKMSLKNALNKLTEKDKEMVKSIIAGNFTFKSSADRLRFKRILDKIKSDKQENKKFVLTNMLTGQEYAVTNLVEASKIAGCTHELVRQALKKNGIFKKKTWKISNK
jgi:DNA-directed RNA polymerase specialized sigma24 family protein